MSEMLKWKVHVVDLFKEIAANPDCSQIVMPLNILKNILAEVSQRATEINDPKLNKLMIRLSLYSISDPHDPDYNPELVRRILNE